MKEGDRVPLMEGEVDRVEEGHWVPEPVTVGHRVAEGDWEVEGVLVLCRAPSRAMVTVCVLVATVEAQ